MSSIPQRLFNEVMMIDDFTCVYCGIRTPDITIDHFIPPSQGGPDVLANLFACCRSCNSRKSDRPIDVAGMDLLYGRFERVRVLPKRTVLKPTEQAIERAIPLAKQVDETGAYCYSANEIVRTVGGDRNAVLATIKELRAVPPSAEFRQPDGSTAPARYPVTSR